MDITDAIDWESLQSHVLLNPGMPGIDREGIITAVKSQNSFPGHIWLTTSGSSGVPKCVALSKRAILTSAAAVNKHLECSASDIWLNSLPTFHVGGLAIKARSFLSGAKMIESTMSGKRWNPFQFLEQVVKNQATLTALVPTQIFDLLREKLVAPDCLRAVVVGGGAINETIYEQAIALKWKLLPSYGSTECASQIATAGLNSWNERRFPLLQPLEHIHIAMNNNGFLQINSDALLTCYGCIDSTSKLILNDPKVNGWLTTEDRVILKDGLILSVSREGDFVKIGGESVDLLRLDKILDEIKILMKIDNDMSIFASPDSRLGYVIQLAIAKDNCINTEQLLNYFQARVHPFERIRAVHYVSEIPRSPLNKILRHKIIETVKAV